MLLCFLIVAPRTLSDACSLTNSPPLLARLTGLFECRRIEENKLISLPLGAFAYSTALEEL
jgi:hypothetical protein